MLLLEKRSVRFGSLLNPKSEYLNKLISVLDNVPVISDEGANGPISGVELSDHYWCISGGLGNSI